MAATADSTTPPRRRRRFQFSLRTALFLMFIACVIAGAFTWRLNRARHQARIIAALQEMGGSVTHDGGDGWAPFKPTMADRLWDKANELLGKDFFLGVETVWVTSSNSEESERSLKLLSDLPRVSQLILNVDVLRRGDLERLPFRESLTRLYIQSNSIEPGSLSSLRDCRKLWKVSLSGPGIGNDELAQVSTITWLHHLTLRDTKVTDEGLKHLSLMRELNQLEIIGTKIQGRGFAAVGTQSKLGLLDLSSTVLDDEGLMNLQVFPGLRNVILDKTRVQGLGLLPELKHLNLLWLRACPIGDNGLEDFLKRPKTLTSINLSNTRVTDKTLDRLSDHAQLLSIDVKGTNVSPTGINRFKAKLPTCFVHK